MYPHWKPKIKAKPMNEFPRYIIKLLVVLYFMFYLVLSRVNDILIILKLLVLGHSYGPWVSFY